MESIIIFVLIAIATSVFQSFNQSNKQNKHKQATPYSQVEVPKVQPTVEQTSKPIVIKSAKAGSQTPQMAKPKMQAPKASAAAAVYTEGIQSEALYSEAQEDTVKFEQRSEQAGMAGIHVAEGITLSDMQRSIVMAEILGKPVALRNIKR